MTALPRDDGIVVDQQPRQTGGPSSDMLFLDSFGLEVWQQEADNIRLTAPATVRRVSWWGFYGGDEQDHQPPAGDETMRIRFYAARPSDGLPGDILLEKEVPDPSRTATGKWVYADVDAPEYLFQVDLPSPVALDAATLYWLEIVQLDDLDSTFRWETGIGTQSGHAFVNRDVPDWRFTSSGNFAFQLSAVPEPAAPGAVALGFLLIRRKASLGGRRCRG